jgi:hypothetical protein
LDDEDAGNNHFLLRDVMYDADRFFLRQMRNREKERKTKENNCVVFIFFLEKK